MHYLEGYEVAEVAEELHLSDQRIRALLASGGLEGVKVAGRWFVRPESIDRWRHRRDVRGRPLSAENSWALLLSASGLDPAWRSPWDKSRLRARLAGDWEEWLPRLRNRADSRSYYAHLSQIKRLRSDPQLVLSGVSAPGFGSQGVVSSNELEAYVREDDLQKVVDRYKLSSSSRPNTRLHVVSGYWPFDDELRSAPPAVVALDLIESGDPRSVRQGKSLLRRLKKQTKNDSN